MFIIAGLMLVSAHFIRSVISWSVFIDLFSSWICGTICGIPPPREEGDQTPGAAHLRASFALLPPRSAVLGPGASRARLVLSGLHTAVLTLGLFLPNWRKGVCFWCLLWAECLCPPPPIHMLTCQPNSMVLGGRAVGRAFGPEGGALMNEASVPTKGTAESPSAPLPSEDAAGGRLSADQEGTPPHGHRDLGLAASGLGANGGTCLRHPVCGVCYGSRVSASRGPGGQSKIKMHGPLSEVIKNFQMVRVGRESQQEALLGARPLWLPGESNAGCQPGSDHGEPGPLVTEFRLFAPCLLTE